MKKINFYQHIRRFSLLYTYYAFVDTESYLADQLFAKHQVQVHFGAEYVREGSPYHVIFCRVRKRDEGRFHGALEELPNKMMLLGYTDYLDTCYTLWGHRSLYEEGSDRP